MKKIGILGGGVWGSALAKILNKNNVVLFARDQKIVKSINNFKLNPKLKYATFNDNVSATTSLSDLKDCEYLIIALPTNEIREVIKSLGKISTNQHIIIGSKGIEIKSKMLPYDILKTTLDTNNISILSGPCFSIEVAQNLPTAVTLAAHNINMFNEINLLFSNKNFRLYFSDDITGCQLGGALKNIYAIAVGITIGLNLGENAKSALISRSFAEIIKFANLMNAKPQTIFGLSGLGDLILTCNSLKSRNTSFGQFIGSHKKIDIPSYVKTLETTEGYYTVKAVHEISLEKNISMPIADAVYNILYNSSSISDEINTLLNRPATKEFID